MTLEDKAAMYLEENNISGDTMVLFDHNIKDIPPGGAMYLYDLMVGFIKKVKKNDKVKDNYQVLIEAVRDSICNCECDDPVFDNNKCPHYPICQGAIK